jgi:hypothetical protein
MNLIAARYGQPVMRGEQPAAELIAALVKTGGQA